MFAPKLVLPLALISLHQLGWDCLAGTSHLGSTDMGISWNPVSLFLVLFRIKSGIDHRMVQMKPLGWASPVRAWLCWGLLVGVGSWAGKMGVLLHLGAMPSAKKRVMSVGKFCSSPNSLSTLNQTCFLGFSSACGEMLHCNVLLLDSQDLGHRQNFPWSSGATHQQDRIVEG